MEKIIVANLKMNLISHEERTRYLKMLRKALTGKDFSGRELVFCPPFVHLEYFSKELKGNKNLKLGAQNVFWEKEGAYTGEISPLQLKDLGVEYAIVGHSERRYILGERDSAINKKVLALLKNNLRPILCIGETSEEKELNQTAQVITRQLELGLKGIRPGFLENLVIAYEPVWSVGTDVIPLSNEVMSAKLIIRKVLTGKWGRKYTEKVRIIYGGSVSGQTIEELCVKPQMDGVLVGRQSLYPAQFIKIAEKC